MTEKGATLPVKGEKGENGAVARRPFDMLETLQEEMARIWDRAWPLGLSFRPRFFRDIPLVPTTWTPRLDVFEKEGHLVVKAELPGVKKEDIEVSVEGGDLLIRGERSSEKEVKEEHYYRMERDFGSFFRRLPLSADVKAQDVTATFVDGVLEVKVPKPAEKESERKRVAIG